MECLEKSINHLFLNLTPCDFDIIHKSLFQIGILLESSILPLFSYSRMLVVAFGGFLSKNICTVLEIIFIIH